jgi:hypothetical protein
MRRNGAVEAMIRHAPTFVTRLVGSLLYRYAA